MRATLTTTRVLGLAMLAAMLATSTAAQSGSPAYLFLLEGKGVPTGTIHAFSIDTSTGALSEISGSPFSAGLGPQQMVVDPTNRFLYVMNQNSKDITGFSIDPATGSLALLPGAPFFIGADPVTMGIDPTGRFLYVFAGTTINALSQESLFEYNIDPASGALTLTASSPTVWEASAGTLITSMAFNPVGNITYLGQSASNGLHGPILICAVDFTTGALTRTSLTQPRSIQSDHLGMSAGGSFLFSTSAPGATVDAFAIGTNGAPLEVSGSPYPIGNVPAAVLVHPSGNFVYVVNEGEPYLGGSNLSAYAGSVSAFSVSAGTGVLAVVPASPFPAGTNPASIGIDPTGSFAYVPLTGYVAGTFKSSAQIQGYNIDPSSGALAPLAGPAWTDSAQSTATQVVIADAASATPNPTPAISSLSPSSIAAAGPAFTLQITGTGFMSGSRAYFAGQPRNTTFISPTQLDVSVLAGDISNEGTAVVFVFNPLPGGGASQSLEFTVTSPLPILTSMSPGTVAAQPGGLSVFISGSNFLTSSAVNLNGIPVTTVYLGSTGLRGDLPSGAVVAPGTVTITVTNPPNAGVGGGTSNPLTLTIVPPLQKFAVTGISPASAQAGGLAFTLTVTGTGFVAPAAGPPSSPGSQVTFGLASVPTTFVSSTQLTAAIPASAIALPGNPYVIVTNPNGSASTPITFTVNSPAPGGGSVTPPTLPAGSSALTLNVAGTGFEPSSIVLVNGSPRPTTYVSSILLQVTLSPSDISQGGTLNITVFTPPPGGGTSEGMNLNVMNPQPRSISISPSTVISGSAASTVTITGTGFVASSMVLVNSTPRTASVITSTSIELPLLASDLAQGGALEIVVSNPSPGGGASAVVPFFVEADSLKIGSSNIDPVAAGQTATVQLSFSSSSGTIANPVRFKVTAAAPDARGTLATSFQPSATLAAGPSPLSVTLSVTTEARAAASSMSFPRGLSPARLGIVLLLLAMISIGLVSIGPNARFARLAPQFLLLGLLCGAATLAACAGAGAGSSSTAGTSPPSGTPAGTYTITVTATSAGVAHDATVTLQVM